MTNCPRRLRLVAPLLAMALVMLVLPAAGPGAPGASTAFAAAAPTCVATAFRTRAAKKVYYRIPSVVVTPKRTLVAFAERRHATGAASDLSDTEIVTARSTDRGCHWTAPRVIADVGDGTVGNPTPVVDTSTGDVLLFSIHRPKGGTTGHGFHQQRSTDDGKTFTAYSRSSKDLSGIPGWSGGLTGPGHALQLHSPKSKHPGRLVVPMGYKDGSRYGGYAVVSDDHGRTWKVGYKAAGDDGRIEGTVAELPDGRLWISYRNRNSRTPVGQGRISTFSSDGGSSLDAPFRNAGLPVVSVQGSSLALTGKYAGTLLFSAPTLKDAYRRHRMGIFASRGATVGTRWAKPFSVQKDSRPAAYSDLVQLSPTTIAVLYETGQKSSSERIDFRSLRLSAVLG